MTATKPVETAVESDTALEKEVDTPWNIAKYLGCRPQRIYMLVKQGKIPSWRGETAIEVNVNDVRKALGEAPGRRGRPKGAKSSGTGTQGSSGRVKERDIVSWPRMPGGGTTIAQVTRITGDDDEVDSSLTFMRALNSGEPVVFASGSLEAKVKRGLITIEDPLALLEMIHEQAVATQMHAGIEAELEKVIYRWKEHAGVASDVLE